MDEAHTKRVRDELKAVGVGSIGLLTPESRHLASLLHADEHIGGAVYGRYSGGLAWLVATSHRILFMDHKPLYTTTDEMTYDVIVGVQSTQAGPFDAVILRTRVNNYTIRFVNSKCARIFIDFIETRRLEGGTYDHATDHFTMEQKEPPSLLPLPVFQVISGSALNFLERQDLAVLSTVDRTGNVHGAVVYYLIQNSSIYILTKSGTDKGSDIPVHGQVAFTVHEPGTTQTVQIQGIAEIETDQKTKDSIFTKMVKLRPYVDEVGLPPVTKLHDGAFIVIRITPTLINYHDYAKMK